MILLGTIDDFFTISGRGTVIAPLFPENREPDVKFRVGDKIQLRRTNGLAIDTEIRGIEFLTRIKPRPPGTNIGILMPKEINPATLSKGMEIWLVRRAEETAEETA